MISQGSTPCHEAAKGGRSEVVGVLIGALANPNSRMVCMRGDTVVLRGKANPFLTKKGNPSWGGTAIPIDVAAFHGHSDVVCELAQWKGCGVASAGNQALLFAASKQHLDTMAILTGTGVDRVGLSLLGAAGSDIVASVKFLSRQRYNESARSIKYLYVNARDTDGCTPLAHTSCISRCCSHAPRIVRLVFRAGADVVSAIRVTNSDGEQEYSETPLAVVAPCLREKVLANDTPTTEEHLYRLEAIRRLLVQIEAVHAVP
ncbi:unnamed protein product [Ectocarpus sp. 12 AP-2014]